MKPTSILRATACLALLAMMAIAGCNDPTAPRSGLRLYVLSELDNKPLAVYSRTIADTLVVDSKFNRGFRAFVYAGDDGIVRRIQHEFALSNNATTIALDFHCLPASVCEAIYAPSVATIGADSIVFPANNFSTKRVYVRP